MSDRIVCDFCGVPLFQSVTTGAWMDDEGCVDGEDGHDHEVTPNG